MDILGQLITIGAVVIGAAGSYVVSRLSDQARFTKELQIRWDQRRLDAYLSYAAAVKRSCSQAGKALNMKSARPDDSSQRLAELRSSELHRSELFEAVVLLGDKETVEAAHQLNQKLWNLVRLAERGDEIDRETWEILAHEWVIALNDYHNRARASLGVQGMLGRRDVAVLPLASDAPFVPW